jgi:hypothetical protein
MGDVHHYSSILGDGVKEFCVHRNELSGFIKRREYLDNLNDLGSQEGPFSMEFVM